MIVTIDRNPQDIPEDPTKRHAMRWGYAETQNLTHIRNYKSGSRSIPQFSALEPSMPRQSSVGRKRLRKIHDNLYVAQENGGDNNFYIDIQSGHYVDDLAFHITTENPVKYKEADMAKVITRFSTGVFGFSKSTINGMEFRLFYTDKMMTRGVAVSADQKNPVVGLFEVK